jgi:hypothetical protein
MTEPATKKVMLYKITAADGSSCHGGAGKWDLPTGKPGRWRTVKRDDRLPVRMKCGKGELTLWKFTDEGFVVEENDTEGDLVRFVVVFDD